MEQINSVICGLLGLAFIAIVAISFIYITFRLLGCIVWLIGLVIVAGVFREIGVIVYIVISIAWKPAWWILDQVKSRETTTQTAPGAMTEEEVFLLMRGSGIKFYD